MRTSLRLRKVTESTKCAVHLRGQRMEWEGEEVRLGRGHVGCLVVARGDDIWARRRVHVSQLLVLVQGRTREVEGAEL